MTKDDGGPAFPSAGHDVSGSFVITGMSLRDWFAGQVANGLAGTSLPLKDIPVAAYEVADAMLKTREKKA